MKQIYVASYFGSGYSRFMKYVHDVFDHPQRESIEKRLEIIKFCDDFGFEATRQAFGKSRSTIYLWKQKLKNSSGKLSVLAPGNRTPRNKRHRVVDPFIERFIVDYRSEHPGADKTTITPALTAACIGQEIKPVSESTIGRIIHDLKAKGRLPYSNKISIRGGTGTLLVREAKQRMKKLRRKDYVPHLPGDLVQIDTVAIFTAGLKRYIFIPMKSGTYVPALPWLMPIRRTLRLTAVISSGSSLKWLLLSPDESRQITAVNSLATLTFSAQSTN